MIEKCASKESELIERIIDRDGDGLQGRKILREKLCGKTFAELEKIWERRDTYE